MKKQAKYSPEDQLFTNLEKFQSIDVHRDWENVKDRIGFRKPNRLSTLLRVAAIFIALISIGFLSRQFLFPPADMLIASAESGLTEIHLPDGSVVHLNNHSELAYPEKFTGRSRQVRLAGEAFFEVTSDPEQAFRVNVADRASVEVLGTSFNISSLSDAMVEIQVLEGKVSFSGTGSKRTGEILEKNEMAILQNGIITKSELLNNNFLSWKTGILTFDQEIISGVVETLETYYNREINLDVSVDTNLIFTSIIDNQELESVLEELKLVLGISYSVYDTKVELYMSD